MELKEIMPVELNSPLEMDGSLQDIMKLSTLQVAMPAETDCDVVKNMSRVPEPGFVNKFKVLSQSPEMPKLECQLPRALRRALRFFQ